MIKLPTPSKTSTGKSLFGGAALLLSALLAGPASAAPFLFTGTGLVDGSNGAGASINMPGVSFGSTMTLKVIVDNGNNTLVSQNWGVADIVSATLSVGSYTASFTPAYDAPYTGFSTGAAGQILTASFVDCCTSNTITDNYGTGNGSLSYNAFFSYTSGQARYFYWTFPNYMIGANHWTVQAAPTPEPAAFALLSLGLLGLGLRRRQAA